MKNFCFAMALYGLILTLPMAVMTGIMFGDPASGALVGLAIFFICSAVYLAES